MNNSGIYSGTCNPILINSSFLRNSASSPSTGWAIASSGYQGTSYHVLVNCIFFDNGGNRTFSIYFNATLTTTYSLFEPTAVSGVAGLNLTGPGNLTNVIVSPFASTTSVSLAPNSPAIDAGDPATSSATVGLTDLAGNLRFVGRIDMGAVEFQQLPEIYSLKDGNWTDPLVWSVGRIPQLGERVRLKHTITIPAASTASGIVIIYDPASKLIYETGSKLQLGN